MVSGKYSAVAGAVAREQSIANISANLANVNTTGYKRTGVSFESILRGTRQNNEAKGINYSRVNANTSDFTSGPLRQTGKPLDVALHGDGFFKVQGENGQLYTRRGDFVVDQDGVLKTTNGLEVLDDANGTITIPDTGTGKVNISQDGTIAIIDPDGTVNEVGQLGIVEVDDRKLLKREEDTTFSLKRGGNEIPVDQPAVVQGSLEVSNVNMTMEMTKMIDSYRTYETYHKVLESYSKIGQKQDELGTVG